MFYVHHDGAWACLFFVGFISLVVIAFLRMVGRMGRAVISGDEQTLRRAEPRQGDEEAENEDEVSEQWGEAGPEPNNMANGWECPYAGCGAVNRPHARFCRLCGRERGVDTSR
jgi:hypothetical protein